MTKRIGILTGGGDVPGLNNCIKAVVQGAVEQGWEVVGFKRGWAGPLMINPDGSPEENSQHLMDLDWLAVRSIDRLGGTILHSSRTNPSRVKAEDKPDFVEKAKENPDGTLDCTAHILKVLDHLGLAALVPIGGDDTLSYAARLDREGYRVAAAPKTMDNDVWGTDYCMGFGTAVARSVDMINALRTPTGSHERIAIVELFGRNSGATALMAGLLGAVDRVLIPEVPFDFDMLTDKVSADRAANPSGYAMVAVSEGAFSQGGTVQESGEADAYGHKKLGGIGELVGAELKRRTGLGIIGQNLGYLMRAGEPDTLDKLVCMAYGRMVVDHLARGETGRMMALVDGRYTSVPLSTVMKGARPLDVAALYDAEEYRPRVTEFAGMPLYLR